MKATINPNNGLNPFLADPMQVHSPVFGMGQLASVTKLSLFLPADFHDFSRSGLVLALVFGLSLVIFLAFSKTQKMEHKQKQEQKQQCSESPGPLWPVVPGARPFVGNTIPGGFKNSTICFEDWAARYGENGIFECNIFGKKLIVLYSDETISALDKHRPYDIIRRSRTSEVLDSLGATGIFTAEGAQWKRERRLVGPALNRKNVKDYVSVVKLVASRLVQKWEDAMEKDGSVLANDDLLCYSVDIISLVVFATDVNSVQTGDKGICSEVQNVLSRAALRIFAPFPYWNIPVVGQYLDGAGFCADRAKATMRGILRDHESPPLKGKDHPRGEDGTTPRVRKTFLAKLLALTEEKGVRLSEDRVIGNLITMFAAGSETTSVTILDCIYELALDKTLGGSLQDEIAGEVLEMFRGASGGSGNGNNNGKSNQTNKGKTAEETIDFDRLNEGLPRLRSLLYEVLRVKGPSPMNNGEARTDVEVNGIVFPAGTQFLLLARYASRVETLWSALHGRSLPGGPEGAGPGAFCPRRWLVVPGGGTASDRQSKHRNHHHHHDGSLPPGVGVTKPTFRNGFRAFGTGPRVCPGRDLAEVEVLVMVSFLLKRFEVSLEGGRSHPPMEYTTSVTFRPSTDVRLVLAPR
ncbi:unnamed protein product [Pseudo-nitzschia multistriata]|uniref:Cytochrome P450 n=1 Tax=Pseudo-nitzschia multistriata TaxID=183589 RepID=A0A448ZAB0_9STRA|nr:unnamed protein product [Pseudo-nitzschia multistriata]